MSAQEPHHGRILEQLSQSNNPTSQIEQLRKIKNALIGHELRKREYIRGGVLPVIADLLCNNQVLPEHQERLHIECANIVCILAHEGPAFVSPILHSKAHSVFLSRLSDLPSIRESLALLRCLNAIADGLPPREPGQWLQDAHFADLLYMSSNTAWIISNVRDASSPLASQQVCDKTIALLCKTCSTTYHKRLLVDSGFLSALAERMASFVVAGGLVSPSLELLDFPSTVASSLPASAPTSAHLSPTLEAIILLIEGSKERAEAFINDSAITCVLPKPRSDFSPATMRQSTWASNAMPSAISRLGSFAALDGLLPHVPPKEKCSSPSNLNFPPLGSGGFIPRRRTSFQPTMAPIPNTAFSSECSDSRYCSTLIPYLILLAREPRARRRLLASKLLVHLHDLELVPKGRSKSLGALLIPVLIRLLDHQQGPRPGSSIPDDSCLCNGMHYSKAVPEVLAMLIMDDADMQKMAVETKAIVKLSVGLKGTFDVSDGRKAMPWRPRKINDEHNLVVTPERLLGSGGPSQTMRHEMAYREGTLQALAAIAPFNDDYRKQICDQGALTQIMLAMKPFHSNVPNAGTQIESAGNSAATILAACNAVRALTRSVTALRTKLVDAEVAKAVIDLMNSPDPEVRIAATKVLANLAMDFSPMKESVGESSVVKKLCEQAHSANARLRLESIWALKQLAVNASNKLKREIINELGSSWLKLLIRTDPCDIPAGEVIGLVDKEYPPRGDNEGAAPSEDIVMSEESDGETPISFAEAPAPSSREAEDDFNRHTPEADLAIQEQVLDLIRNLFCGENSSDVVDYVIGEMGRDDFFKIMKARIEPRRSFGSTRKDNQEKSAPGGLIAKVLYIIVHVAAASQQWRVWVAGENALLRMILTFTTHAEREIRVQTCWLAINLMFEDDINDRSACRRRAQELQKAGFRKEMQRLEQDSDLDVRERAKTAVHFFTNLLDARR